MSHASAALSPYKRQAVDLSSDFMSPLKESGAFFEGDDGSDPSPRHAKIPRVTFSNLDTHVYWTHADVRYAYCYGICLTHSPRMIKTIAQLPETTALSTASPNTLKRKLKEDFASLQGMRLFVSLVSFRFYLNSSLFSNLCSLPDMYPVASKKKLESQLRHEMAEESKDDDHAMPRLLKSHQTPGSALAQASANGSNALALARVEESLMPEASMKPFLGQGQYQGPGQGPGQAQEEAEEALMAEEEKDREYV
jgi:hypothetical protein